MAVSDAWPVRCCLVRLPSTRAVRPRCPTPPPAVDELEDVDRRRVDDRRTPRERYTDEDLERWAVHLAEHGERRGPWWRERREAAPSPSP